MQIIVRDEKDNPNYGDIGHNSYSDNPLGFLWFWIDNKLIVEEQDYRGIFTHEKMVPGYKGTDYYKGRYDPGTNKVSLVGSPSNMFRPIPNPLLKALADRFGKEIEIHVF